MIESSTVTTPAPAVVQLIARNPALIRIAVALLSLLLATASVYTGSKLFTKSTDANTESKESKEPKPTPEVNPSNELQKQKYRVPFIFVGLLTLVKIGLLFWHSTRNRLDNGHFSDTDARTFLLLFAGSFGFILALYGLTEFISSRESLQKWLYDGSRKEGRIVIVPLLILFVGLLSMFFGLMPARAEIRSSSSLRRLVFGYNAILTGLLVLMLLTMGNIASYLKLPGKLDTTENQFFTLSETSKRVLSSLEQPINVYVLLSERVSIYEDVQSLLNRCKEIAPANLQISEISPSNLPKIEELVEKFGLRQSGGLTMGLLVTLGTDESIHSFIRAEDLIDQISAPGSPNPPTPIFQGESKLITEIAFLTQGKTKSVLYFTQGHGELSIDPTERDPSKSANELKKYLEEKRFEVKPLRMELGKKPNLTDAAMIVILAPTSAFRPDEVAVLEEYLKPMELGKKTGGKLLAFLPPVRDPENPRAMQTGLEGLLNRFDVQPSPDYFLSLVVTGNSYRSLPQVFLTGDRQLMEVSSPLSDLVLRHRAYAWTKAREIRAGELSENLPNGIRWAPLLRTANLGEALIWRETNFDVDLRKITEEMVNNEQTQKLKQLGVGGSAVVMIGAEGGSPMNVNDSNVKPRFAVVGASDFIADATLMRSRGEKAKALELTTGLVDWLRERPTNIGISPKEFRFYEMPLSATVGNTVFIPVGLVILSIIGIGVGVWITRRK